MELFTRHGFRVVSVKRYRLPLPTGFERNRLATPWRALDEDTLSIAQLAVVLD